jgi:hypothetical protein
MPDNPRARPVSLVRKIAYAKEQIAYYRTTDPHDPETHGRLDLWIARLQDLEQKAKKGLTNERHPITERIVPG